MNDATPQPGQRVLIVFRITHEDRPGQTGTTALRCGEIAAVEEDQVIIAADSGEIIHCPKSALHPAGPDWPDDPPFDWFAAGFFPAMPDPYTLEWLGREKSLEWLRS